ncbi:hypothetical protein [Snodgrassella communis]|jgi:hypothetical protein|uniref:Uncharacterized protein n=1 Tax=Snodgrassella alvi TaxID=1196083 RepID=A0A2N9XS39_9NEIS|nr:hypothetical protein [Snodgrassella communis]PIT06812.1 hypothetical protein BGI31_10725 [Snodgrassella communis]PIT51445.1 hypothetical protein BHC48_03925 [Snodgrassella communis]
MSMKISGLDNLSKKLNKIKKSAEKIHGNHSVPITEFFNNEFMCKYSKFKSFGEFADKSGFDFSDIESINDAELDAFICKKTSFSSWEEMKSAAAKDWALKQLEF